MSPAAGQVGPAQQALRARRVVAVANQKGGVGKTTTAVNLGAYLGRFLPTLLVDLDPQANATASLGLNPRQMSPSMYEVLLGSARLEQVVRPSGQVGLDLAPAAHALAGAQVDLVELPEREARLRQALDALPPRHELVLIDCPPSLGLLTLNALVAADAVLVPVQCEYLALEGLSQLMETLGLVRQELNPRLEVLGLVLTMHDSRTNLSSQVIQEVRTHFPGLAFESVIPRTVRLSEAPSYGESIFGYAPDSRGARSYAALAEEALGRLLRGRT